MEDVEFLKAVKKANENPGVYESTHASQVPADKETIQKLTKLSESKVRYRLDPEGKMFGEKGLGLIRIYEPNEEYITYSAELTDRGLEALSTYEEAREGGSVDGEVGALSPSEQIGLAFAHEETQERLDEFEERLGEVDEKAERAREASSTLLTYFEDILGMSAIDLFIKLREEGDGSGVARASKFPGQVEQARDSIRSTLFPSRDEDG